MDGLTDLERQVVRCIDQNRERIIDFLKNLVSFPSVTGHEKHVQEFLSGVLSDAELETDLFDIDTGTLSEEPLYMPPPLPYEGRPNVVAIRRGAGGGRSLLFNGHVDVIPADREAWKFDPWASEIRDGILYGRGASDMKSGLAAMTMAILTLCSMKIRLRGDVILHYVVDEESNGNGTLSCCVKGYTADAAISCEASDLEIQPAATGSMWFEIEVEGRGASMSRRWEGVSAIEKACLICQAIDDFERIRIREARHPMYPDTRGPVACFVGTLNAGTFASAPPSKAKITGRMGILPGEDHLKAQWSFEDFMRSFCESDPWLREHQPQVSFKGMLALPAEIPPDSEIVKIVKEAYRAVMEKEPVITGHHGGADTRILINRFHIPSVIFGPGLISQMHADNESMRVDDLIPATKVMAVAVMRWCGISE